MLGREMCWLSTEEDGGWVYPTEGFEIRYRSFVWVEGVGPSHLERHKWWTRVKAGQFRIRSSSTLHHAGHTWKRYQKKKNKLSRISGLTKRQ